MLEPIDYIKNHNYGKYRFGDYLDNYTTTNNQQYQEGRYKNYLQLQPKVNEQLKYHSYEIGHSHIPKEQQYMTHNKEKYGKIVQTQPDQIPSISVADLQREKNSVINQIESNLKQGNQNLSVSQMVYDDKSKYPKNDIKLDHKEREHQVNIDQMPYQKLLNTQPPLHLNLQNKKSYKKRYTNESQIILGIDRNKYFLSESKKQQQDYENYAKSLPKILSPGRYSAGKIYYDQHNKQTNLGQDNVGKSIQVQKDNYQARNSQNDLQTQSPAKQQQQQEEKLPSQQQLSITPSLPNIIPLRKQYYPNYTARNQEGASQQPSPQLQEQLKQFNIKHNKSSLARIGQSSYEYYNQQKKLYENNSVLYGRQGVHRLKPLESEQNLSYKNDAYYQNQPEKNLKTVIPPQQSQDQILLEMQKQRIPISQRDDLISTKKLQSINNRSNLQQQWEYDHNYYKSQQNKQLQELKARQQLFNSIRQDAIQEVNQRQEQDQNQQSNKQIVEQLQKSSQQQQQQQQDQQKSPKVQVEAGQKTEQIQQQQQKKAQEEIYDKNKNPFLETLK